MGPSWAGWGCFNASVTVTGGPRRGFRRVRPLTVAVALLIAAVAVVAATYLVPVVVPLAPTVDPARAADVTRAPDAPTGDDPSSGASSPDPVVEARVVASSSCAAPDARDTVSVTVGGAVREVPVESCGNRVGALLTVEVPADGPARVRGTGASAARPDVDGSAVNTPATRVAVILVVVAALGTGGLVVAVVRGRRPARTPLRR